MASGTPAIGAAQMNVHSFPDRFCEPAAHAAAVAVADGDVAAAIAAIRRAPGSANTPGAHGTTLLLMAVERRNHAMATALLRAGASPDGTADRAPLVDAVKNQDLGTLRLLLAARANPDATMEGDSPLFEAGLIGAQDAAGLLLAAGAHIDAPDEVGNTPVLSAAAADNWAMVGYLLDRGANPWLDAHGLTLPGFAANSRILPNNLEGAALPGVIARLRNAGCPWPPPNVIAIRAMKAQGQWPPAGVPARLADRAPLVDAVKNQDVAMLRLLLAARANPDATMEGDSPLFEAALIGAQDAAGLLLAAGANINLPDEVGKTPLLVAAATDSWAMVGFLLDRGANPWLDAHGITVPDLAVDSRILPNNPDGAALPGVIARLRNAGCPWPPPNVIAVRAMKAQGQWPPAGVPARLP